MRKIILYIALLAASFVLSANTHAQQLAVVVSSEVEIEKQIDKRSLLDIYTLRVPYWDSGEAIRITDYKGRAQIRSDFYEYLDVSVQDIRRLWLREQFTGKSVPPSIVRNVEEMIRVIRETPGTVGYIPLEQVPEDFRIIHLTDD